MIRRESDIVKELGREQTLDGFRDCDLREIRKNRKKYK